MTAVFEPRPSLGDMVGRAFALDLRLSASDNGMCLP
jgi:hypothetical protein